MVSFDEHPNYRKLFESLGFEYRGCDSYATYSVDVFCNYEKKFYASVNDARVFGIKVKIYHYSKMDSPHVFDGDSQDAAYIGYWGKENPYSRQEIKRNADEKSIKDFIKKWSLAQ